MTIQFEDFLKWLESFRPADPLARHEPIYIRLRNDEFKTKDTLTYSIQNGMMFALDIDKDDELCGIEII